LFIEPARVEAITAADVQRVAADMFRPQNRVTGVVRRGEASPLVRRA
jgi:predicted Zn-dependent peptidase